MHMHVHVVCEGSGLILCIFFIPIWRLSISVTKYQIIDSIQFCLIDEAMNKYHRSLWHNSSSTWFSSILFFPVILLPHSFIHFKNISFSQLHEWLSVMVQQKESVFFYLPFQILISVFLLFYEQVDGYIVKLFLSVLSILHSLN